MQLRTDGEWGSGVEKLREPWEDRRAPPCTNQLNSLNCGIPALGTKFSQDIVEQEKWYRVSLKWDTLW